jgi:ATP-dependent helicase STH1/SNF2
MGRTIRGMSIWQYFQTARLTLQWYRNSGSIKGLSNELMQLCKICQHPFLFESVEDKNVNDKLIRSSGKIELLSHVLPKFFATGHRVGLWQTKKVELWLTCVTTSGSHLLSDDETEEHASFVQLFNAKESEYMVFIWSMRAGGLSLNLQTADTCKISISLRIQPEQADVYV